LILLFGMQSNAQKKLIKISKYLCKALKALDRLNLWLLCVDRPVQRHSMDFNVLVDDAKGEMKRGTNNP